MRVFFSLGIELYPTDDKLTYIDEVTFIHDLELYREFLAVYNPGHERGALHIEADAYNQTCIQDELWYLVTHLCFRAAPALLSRQSYQYRYTDYYPTAQLLPAQDNTYILGKYVAPIVAPTYAMVQALYECGLRYLDFLLRLDEAQHKFTVDYLRGEAKIAEEALNHQRG